MKKYSNTIFFTIFLTCTYNLSLSQDRIVLDSFRISIDNAKYDSSKLNSMYELSHYLLKYDYNSSLEEASNGYELAQESEEEFWIIKFGMMKGIIYNALGRYDESLKYYLDSQKICEENAPKYNTELTRIFNNIGVLYDRIDNYSLALEYYFKALNQYLETSVEVARNKRSTEAILYNNIANVYAASYDTVSALSYYNKALHIAEKKTDHFSLGMINNNLGKILMEKPESLNKAREHLAKSLKHREIINDLQGIAKSYYFLCQYYFYKNEIDSIEYAAQKSLSTANKIGDLESKISANMWLSKAYELKGNYKDAYITHLEYKVLNDSLINSEKLSEINSLQKNFDVENIEKEEIIKRQQLRLRYQLILIGLILIIAIITLLFIIQRNYKRKAQIKNFRLESDIETKNKELTTNVMYLVRKNELINNVAKDLLHIKKNLKQDNQKPVQDIIFKLNSEVDKDVWQEFEYRFQQVHIKFYANLRKKHPDLSPAEERLSAFLRLNMNTKEISAITHQSYKTIEVARTRLRKKLNLTNTETNLTQYLISL